MAGRSSSLMWAEWRRGLKDLQSAVLNPWNGVTQTHEEPGTIANPTPQLVTEDINGERSYDAMRDQYAARAAPQRDDGDKERA
jgi:hypothetical protein